MVCFIVNRSEKYCICYYLPYIALFNVGIMVKNIFVFAPKEYFAILILDFASNVSRKFGFVVQFGKTVHKEFSLFRKLRFALNFRRT